MGRVEGARGQELQSTLHTAHTHTQSVYGSGGAPQSPLLFPQPSIPSGVDEWTSEALSSFFSADASGSRRIRLHCIVGSLLLPFHPIPYSLCMWGGGVPYYTRLFFRLIPSSSSSSFFVRSFVVVVSCTIRERSIPRSLSKQCHLASPSFSQPIEEKDVCACFSSFSHFRNVNSINNTTFRLVCI